MSAEEIGEMQGVVSIEALIWRLVWEVIGQSRMLLYHWNQKHGYFGIIRADVFFTFYAGLIEFLSDVLKKQRSACFS